MTRIEDPATLLGRLKLGREEFCQRLLTMLILDGAYPKWNTPCTPSPRGATFLHELDRRSFGSRPWPSEPVFVDEFELLPRTDGAPAGYPDYAVGWPHRLWLIELKTEAASHRPNQIPYYFELGHHNRPDCAIDITYLTPPMTKTVDTPDWGRYAQVIWPDIVEVITDTWGTSTDPAVGTVVDALVDTIDRMSDENPSAWRARWEPAGAPVKPGEAADSPTTVVVHEPRAHDQVVQQAIDLAEATAGDGRQRALDYLPSGLDDLEHIRLAVRAHLQAAPEGSALRRVQPWLWRWASQGQPLTAAGGETGYELRFSRYGKP